MNIITDLKLFNTVRIAKKTLKKAGFRVTQKRLNLVSYFPPKTAKYKIALLNDSQGQRLNIFANVDPYSQAVGNGNTRTQRYFDLFQKISGKKVKQFLVDTEYDVPNLFPLEKKAEVAPTTFTNLTEKVEQVAENTEKEIEVVNNNAKAHNQPSQAAIDYRKQLLNQKEEDSPWFDIGGW